MMDTAETGRTPALLDPRTRLGRVHLVVSDLELALDFYQRALGLRLHRRGDHQAALGVGLDDLLVLTGNPRAERFSRRSGLYHFALLVPTRLQLARVLQNLIAADVALQGFADHLVSEAIYLADPDGNGIEVYRDRPRSAWQFSEGQLVMDTLPLDAQGLLAELQGESRDWEGMPPETVLGHIHLHVGDLLQAERFYLQIVGFERMARLPSASFVSAGGYHHQIAFNTWNGVGAPPAPAGALGLHSFSVLLSDESEKARLASRLTSAGVALEEQAAGLMVKDPSGNQILFEA